MSLAIQLERLAREAEGERALALEEAVAAAQDRNLRQFVGHANLILYALRTAAGPTPDPRNAARQAAWREAMVLAETLLAAG